MQLSSSYPKKNVMVTYPATFSWWRHQMETFPALLALCSGNSPVTGEFPAQRPVTRSFDVFFDLRLNKRLSKLSWGWWFETLSRRLRRHCNVKCVKQLQFYLKHAPLETCIPLYLNNFCVFVMECYCHILRWTKQSQSWMDTILISGRINCLGKILISKRKWKKRHGLLRYNLILKSTIIHIFCYIIHIHF